jgi:carboxyl-terminal processing protease
MIYRLGANPTAMISSRSNDPYLSRFIENYNTLKNDWYYFNSNEEVIEKATDAMLSSNDNDVYSEYISAKDSETYFDDLESDFVGLGIRYIIINDYPMVVDIYEGSPAQKSGMKIGDYLIKIDDTSLKGLKQDDIKKKIVGKEGTIRTVEFSNTKQNKIAKITIKALDGSVNYRVIDGIGYIHILDFSRTMPINVEKALKEFQKNNVKKVILDLRDNPGGYLDALERLADLFLPSNQIVLSAKDKSGTINSYKTTDNKVYNFNYVLLTNKGTASAAEGFVACLNENLKVPIYGQTTFGKGIMQSFFKYNDDAYLKYTSAEWLTPKGNMINKIGIKPTYELKNNIIVNLDNERKTVSQDIKNNTVNNNLGYYQKALNALSYHVDRTDGYYSTTTNKAIVLFKNDFNLSSEKDLSKKVQAEIIRQITIKANSSRNDDVLNKVMDILK